MTRHRGDYFHSKQRDGPQSVVSPDESRIHGSHPKTGKGKYFSSLTGDQDLREIKINSTVKGPSTSIGAFTYFPRVIKSESVPKTAYGLHCRCRHCHTVSVHLYILPVRVSSPLGSDLTPEPFLLLCPRPSRKVS